MRITDIAAKVHAGGRVGADEALELYRHAPTPLLGQLADEIRARKHPAGVVTYIIDRNVNYTNVCVAKCNFCAFYRDVGSADGYVLGFDELFSKIDETIAVGGVQLLLQGGHNPDLPLTWYEDLFRAIKTRYPSFKLHALSPPEVIHLSRLSQLPVPTIIERLIAAGLDSIPGGGAEILVDRVRDLLHCLGEATADEWLGGMRDAYQAGLRTTATMMYGRVDTCEERIEENVVRAAGASYCMDEVAIVRNIEDAGFVAKRRNMHYDLLGDPVFRERAVPRMLELATARAEGDTNVPEELAKYAPRSRAA